MVCFEISITWTVACQGPLFMGILQARILEWIAVPTPNPGIEPHCRQILYRLSHQGSLTQVLPGLKAVCGTAQVARQPVVSQEGYHCPSRLEAMSSPQSFVFLPHLV